MILIGILNLNKVNLEKVDFEIKKGEKLGTIKVKYKNEIISIEIEEGVTTIGYNAFYSCTSLKEIIIPSTVTGIGNVIQGDNSIPYLAKYGSGFLLVMIFVLRLMSSYVIKELNSELYQNLTHVILPSRLILTRMDILRPFSDLENNSNQISGGRHKKKNKKGRN